MNHQPNCALEKVEPLGVAECTCDPQTTSKSNRTQLEKLAKKHKEDMFVSNSFCEFQNYLPKSRALSEVGYETLFIAFKPVIIQAVKAERERVRKSLREKAFNSSEEGMAVSTVEIDKLLSE